METMYKADRLYNEMMEVDRKIKALEVKDEQSITEYFRLYEELIYNHKWIGSVYDIYADDAKLYRENGDLYDGAHAIMQEALKFLKRKRDGVIIQIYITSECVKMFVLNLKRRSDCEKATVGRCSICNNGNGFDVNNCNSY